jgi:hypothetical protein
VKDAKRRQEASTKGESEDGGAPGAGPDRAPNRFIFIGGVPVFDYMIAPAMDEISRATANKVLTIGARMLLPVGTIFQFTARDSREPVWINPMANAELQSLQDELYYAMDFGGKLPEGEEFTLCAPKEQIFRELNQRFPKILGSPDDLKVVEVAAPVEIRVGGNNRNIIDEIQALYESPELAEQATGIAFEHYFFADVNHPNFGMVREEYASWGVSIGSAEEMHVPGLVPRMGYVLTVTGGDGRALDRIILANRTNEETIPVDQLSRRYFDLEYRLRRDEQFVDTHLVVNSLTNQEEIRFVARLLKTAYASGVATYLCPTLTLLKGIDRLIEERYYAVEKERFYQYRKDFVYSALLPYIQYLILNRDELAMLDALVAKKGIDATATFVAHEMNRGHRGEAGEGGKVIVTGGSKGARYTERLSPERALRFWKKASLHSGKTVRFAERRVVCGDDYVTHLTSTLGAGDVFAGVFIGLTALGWDGGHALRAATLGAQHFIQHRTKPMVRDMTAMDETHIRLGTETELVDVISHHVAESGDPTRYGTIADTVITITTTQIQHPFREILALAQSFARGKSR